MATFVNDCAEREIKLISDFKDICQSEEQQAFYFKLLKIIEYQWRP
jgi:hypothetical protein